MKRRAKSDDGLRGRRRRAAWLKKRRHRVALTNGPPPSNVFSTQNQGCPAGGEHGGCWIEAPCAQSAKHPPPPSSSGLGYQVLILKTGVRVPLGYLLKTAHAQARWRFFHAPPRPDRIPARIHSRTWPAERRLAGDHCRDQGVPDNPTQERGLSSIRSPLVYRARPVCRPLVIVDNVLEPNPKNAVEKQSAGISIRA
jgi:hypothetical protein